MQLPTEWLDVPLLGYAHYFFSIFWFIGFVFLGILAALEFTNDGDLGVLGIAGIFWAGAILCLLAGLYILPLAIVGTAILFLTERPWAQESASQSNPGGER